MTDCINQCIIVFLPYWKSSILQFSCFTERRKPKINKYKYKYYALSNSINQNYFNVLWILWFISSEAHTVNNNIYKLFFIYLCACPLILILFSWISNNFESSQEINDLWTAHAYVLWSSLVTKSNLLGYHHILS